MNAAPPLKRLGRYDIEGILGRGAMGIVYRGVDSQLRRRVAIKTVLKSALEPELAKDYSSRFVREAQAVARLNHPNIIQIHDFGEEGDVAYIVMELIEGRELKDAFDARERFEPREVVRIMSELCGALQFAHMSSVIHRDIKPANIMLDAQGRVKLADFGLARVNDLERTASERTHAGAILGTPAYMSPEQVSGAAVDHRTDVFSAGVVLYQLLTGEKPFKGEGLWTVARKIMQEHPPEPSSVVAAVDPLFDAVVMRALAKNPGDRFQSAADLSHALRRALEGRPDDSTAGAGAPASTLPAAPTTPASPRTASPAGAQVELEFWRSIKDGDDPDDFQLYVDQFPEGIYAALARRKIAKLRGIDPDAGAAAARELERREVEEAAAREAAARARLVEEKARLEEELARREAEYRRVEAERTARAAELERARQEAQQALAKSEQDARAAAARVQEQSRAAARKAEELRHAAEAEMQRAAEARARREAELARKEAELKSRLASARRSGPPAWAYVAGSIAALALVAAAALVLMRGGATDDGRRVAELTAQIEEYKRREADLQKTKDAEAASEREASVARRREAEAQKEAEEARRREEVARKAGDLAKQREQAELAARQEAEARKQAELLRQREAEAKRQAEAVKKQQAELAQLQDRQRQEAARKESDRSAADRAAKERAAQEKAAQEKAAAERAAQDRAAQEKAAAARAEAERERLAKEESDRAAAARTAERAAAERASAEKAAAEKAAAEKAAVEKGAAAKAAPAAVPGEGLFKQAAGVEGEGRTREAVKLYVQAARSGSAAAAGRLAEIYGKGAPDVPIDSIEALKWTNLARALRGGASK